MSSQTVYFNNPSDIVNLQLSSSVQASQITSMSGSISTLNTSSSAQASQITSMSGSISNLVSSQLGYTYAMPSAGQSFDQIDVDPYQLITLYDNLKYAYKQNTGSYMYYMVPEGFPKSTTIAIDDTGITYRSVRPVDLTGDDILYIWSGVVKIIFIVVFGYGYYFGFNNQFVTKLNYIDNEAYSRKYLSSLGTIIKNNSTELANNVITDLSFNANATAQILSNYGDFMLSLSNDNTIFPFASYATQPQFLTQCPSVIKFWEPRYLPVAYPNGMLNMHQLSVTTGTVASSLASSSLQFRPSSSILKGIPYFLSLKVRQLMYLLRESNKQLSDIPEQGIPPIREGSGGTIAPFTGAYGQAYVAGTGAATNLISRLRGQLDEDGVAMFSSTVISSSTTTLNARPSHASYLTANTGASWDNYLTTTGNTAFNKGVIEAVIDGSYELTANEKTDLKNKITAIYNNELLPVIQALYQNYNSMIYTNGKTFYDDNYPSYWRTEIPGQLLYMTGASSSANNITYKYDISAPGNLGTGTAWGGMIINMTGVSTSTINKLISESSSGPMYSITGSTGIYYIPTSHPRIQKYQEHYGQNIASMTNSFQNNIIPLLYKENASIQYYQYTGYNNIIQNYSSTGILVSNISELEDIMTKVGISQLSLFNDYTLYTAEKWIQNPLSYGYSGFGGATGVSSLANLPGYTGWGTNYCSALPSTSTISEKITWLNGYTRYLNRKNTLSDIDVLGYNYGWTGPASSMFVLTGAGFTAPSDSTLASQRGSNGRILYDPTLPFDYIYRQHYPVKASDGTPVTTSGGSTPISSLPYNMQSTPAVNLTIFNSARALTYQMTGYYNPNYSTFVGSFHGMKNQYYMDRLANWLYNSPNSSYLSSGFINRYLLSNTPSSTGSAYMETGPYGRPNKYYRFKITELDTGNNSAAAVNNLTVNGTIDMNIVLLTATPRPYYDQFVMNHENILGHTLLKTTTMIDSYLGQIQEYNWIANSSIASTTRTGDSTMFTVGTAVINEGWATWAEITPLTISDQVFTLTKTGTLGPVVDYSALFQSINNTSRNSGRLIIDVGVNSPRYGWSLGKVVNQYYNFIGQQVTVSFLYRYYTQMGNQLTYGIGLNINAACVSLLYNLLGDDFDPSLFFNQRTTFSEVTGPFLIKYVEDNRDYYRKSLDTSSPFYIAP